MTSKSAQYGKGFEYEIRDMLREVTGIDSFDRVPASGSMFGGKNAVRAVNARDDVVDILTADIICPEGWRWVIECKNHEDVLIHQLYFGNECKTVDEFLSQICDDAQTSGKEPLLVFKVRRKPYCFKKKFVDTLKEAKIMTPKINSITTGIMVAELAKNCSEIEHHNHIQYTRVLEDNTLQKWRFFDFETWLKDVKIRQFILTK